MRYDPDKPYPPGHFYLSRSGIPVCNANRLGYVWNMERSKCVSLLGGIPIASERKALGYIPSDFFK